MPRRLIEMFESMLAAEERASALRNAYGAGAERVLQGLIEKRPAHDPERESLKDVGRALRWL